MAEREASILQLARGAIMERADYEIAKIIDNILDPNTRAAAKRKLSLQIEFIPDDNRQTISVSATAKSTLCPTNPVATALYVTGDDLGEVHAVELVPNIPGQLDVLGVEQEPAPMLKIVRNA
jgi:hypothetical protein